MRRQRLFEFNRGKLLTFRIFRNVRHNVRYVIADRRPPICARATFIVNANLVSRNANNLELKC